MKIWKKNYYEKLFAKYPRTVQDYQLQILHAQEKILELQNKCTHESSSPVMWMSRPGAFNPAKVCNSCNAYLGEPTREESDLLWKEFHKLPEG